MILWFFEAYTSVLGKTTQRALLAALCSFVLALVLGPALIGWLRRRFLEPNISDSAKLAELHQNKHRTPTMGGLFIVAGLVAGVLVFGDLTNIYMLVALLVAVGLAAVGACDDLTKLRGQRNGISARTKLAGQVAVSLAAAALLYQHQVQLEDGLQLQLPLVGTSVDLGLWFIPLAVLVMVGSSNAVNLTDGLDGLAGGCLVFALAALGVVAYGCGHAELAQYLNLPRLPGAQEVLVLVAAMLGGVLGFLWFNCHPAQVFMGDTGSLPLGGLLGLVAVATRQELLLVVVAGVFVAEAVSVMLQVGSYKLRRKRILLCAPLHHHFQFKGWPESKIVVRFWIASALCAVLGLAMIKGTARDGAAELASPASSPAATGQAAASLSPDISTQLAVPE
jgi:phospho-N-acetylmuramoyl-pentapeptide-transferase